MCSITALRDIVADEEILVNYGIGMAHAPSWYKTLWVHHMRTEMGMTDTDMLDWCGRQYAINGRVIELPDIGKPVPVQA